MTTLMVEFGVLEDKIKKALIFLNAFFVSSLTIKFVCVTFSVSEKPEYDFKTLFLIRCVARHFNRLIKSFILTYSFYKKLRYKNNVIN